jgi:glycosyltransferase involved in cell wall biosynthesis
MSRVAAIIPARNEAPTVADSVRAAWGCAYVDEVIVVDDGSSDLTALRAEEAGARVLVLDGSCGSKARAMRAGVEESGAEFLLFVDADLIGLDPRHLDAVCEPVLEKRAELSLGAFDYGRFWNPLVLRWPPLSGERIVPRWVFESIPEAKLDGYTIEVRINEVICEGRHRTVARTMDGVFHRTKRDKFGRIEGLRRTWHMYRALLGMLKPVGDVRWRTYWFYLRGLTIEG